MLKSSLFEDIRSRHQNLRTSFSMDDSGLRFILEQLSKKGFQRILEFGSGLSTVYMAEIIKCLSLNTQINSVEGDAYWLDKVKEHSEKHGLSNHINFIYAPVFPDTRLGKKNKWYNQEILEKQLLKDALFDLVIVDGPMAYHSDIELSRYGAIPFVFSRISDECTIILDDCERNGEKEVMDMWKAQYGLSFDILNNRLGVCHYSK